MSMPESLSHTKVARPAYSNQQWIDGPNIQSVIRLRIPMQRIMLHLRSRSRKIPPKLDIHVPQQAASNLDVTEIRRVPLRPDVGVPQDACGVEVVDKVLHDIVLVHAFDFVHEERSLSVW